MEVPIIEIPTYKVGPNEIVLRLTEAEYMEVNSALDFRARSRKASRKAAGEKITDTRAKKTSYKLGLPILAYKY